MFEFIKFSLKSAFRKRGAALLTIIGIGFGVGMMISLNALSEGLKIDINQEVENAVGIIEVRQENVSQDFYSILDPTSDTLIIQNGPESEKLLQYSREIIFPFSPSDPNLDIGFSVAGVPCVYRYKGYDAKMIIDLNPQVDQIIEGKMYQNDQLECIVPDILYDKYPERLAIGNTVGFIINENTSLDLEIVGIFRANVDPHVINMLPLYDIYMGIDIAQNLQAEILKSANNNYHDIANHADPDGYTVLILKYQSTDINETAVIAEEIKILLDSTYPKIQHQVFAKGSVIKPFEIIQSRVSEFLLIISMITIISGGMSIIIAQLTNAEKRKKEFAILKSTGWKNSAIAHEVFLESISLSLIGGILGILIGIVGISLIGQVFPITAVVTINTILWWIFVVLGLGVIGGSSPAIKAINAKPIEVLRSA